MLDRLGHFRTEFVVGFFAAGNADDRRPVAQKAFSPQAEEGRDQLAGRQIARGPKDRDHRLFGFRLWRCCRRFVAAFRESLDLYVLRHGRSPLKLPQSSADRAGFSSRPASERRVSARRFFLTFRSSRAAKHVLKSFR